MSECPINLVVEDNGRGCAENKITMVLRAEPIPLKRLAPMGVAEIPARAAAPNVRA
ncbi:MAG: hypothetical protein JO166_02530 [Deltaproteobacteria bacterium]|nr:hypothetical protein [Deltaproteobacteria bacterium]